MTYEQLELPICLNASATVLDFHARLSALLDTEEDLKIQEALYSLKSCGWLKRDSLKYFSLKMFQDYLTMRGGHLWHHHIRYGRVGVFCGMASA